MDKNKRRAAQLGMPHGTASNKLRKSLLFKYVSLAGDNFCYKCGAAIETVDELTIEHKQPWEGRDTELFWDLDNIAFSHAVCNKPHKYDTPVHDYPEGFYKCSKCKQLLSLDRFYKSKKVVRGHHSWCKDCHNKERNERLARYLEW